MSRNYWGLDGLLETGFTHMDAHWQWKNGYEVHTGVNLTEEGVRTPFEIYPGVFVPPGSYKNAEANMVFMTNQGAPVSLNVTTFTGGFFAGSRKTVNTRLRMRLRETLTTEVSLQVNDVDFPTDRLHGHSSAHEHFLLVHDPRVPAGARPIQRSGGPLVDEPALRTPPGRQHRPVRGLHRHAWVCTDLIDRPERTDRSFIVKFSRLFDLLR